MSRLPASKPIAPPANRDFPAGSLESELSAIGSRIPARAWADLPNDYFANLDQYLHGPTKKSAPSLKPNVRK
jgi:hypothetical protein